MHKRKVRLETNEKIFHAFSLLQVESNTRVSTRVRLLIKNMFDNRNSGWNKTINDEKEITEDEIKTKMLNFYKSFFIKNEDEDDPYSDEYDLYYDEEDKTPG